MYFWLSSKYVLQKLPVYLKQGDELVAHASESESVLSKNSESQSSIESVANSVHWSTVNMQQ